MSPKRLHILQFVTLAAVFGMTGLLVLPFNRDAAARSPGASRHIYIAFGFHGNLHHSFRNDTNDEQGFGKDIRVIRHTIATLDRLNKEAVPVKAVWDFDNLFSLQEILPQWWSQRRLVYPRSIRRRVVRGVQPGDGHDE